MRPFHLPNKPARPLRQAGFCVKIHPMNLTLKNVFKLSILPILLYALNATVQFLVPNFYILYSIDTYSHFLGGLAIAYAAYSVLSLLEKRNWITIQKNILRAGIVLTTVMAIAVLWEFYEFLYDYFVDASSYLFIMQPSVADTIKDLYMGMFGAIIFCIIILYRADKKYK